MNDRRMMKTTLLILTVLFFSGVCPAQIVELDLQKCRKMAVENSKKLQSAEQQGQKAGFDKKAINSWSTIFSFQPLAYSFFLAFYL